MNTQSNSEALPLTYCSAFYVHRRDRGHWDVSVPDGVGRVFAIRGEPGSFSVTDYRVSPCTQSIGFCTLDVVMAYCMAELMYEPNVKSDGTAGDGTKNHG